MSNITRLPKIAEPTIEQVLNEFLSDQQKRLSPKTARGYREKKDYRRYCSSIGNLFWSIR